MPLPVETPAPKASSLIKRFQQTIDDGPQALPLPRPRLSQDPEEIAQNRKSWSVGSGGAPITINQVIWNNHSRSNSAQLDRPSSGALETSELKSKHRPQVHSRLSTSTATITNHHRSNSSDPSDSTIDRSNLSRLDLINQRNSIHSNLNSLLTPTGDQAVDLSRLNDLSKSDLAVQSPPPLNSKNLPSILPSSSPSLPPSQAPPPRKVKASISAESRPASARTRKQTNLTAPTAASLAKMKASEGPRSVSQPVSKPSTTKPSPTSLAPTKTTSSLQTKSSGKANETSAKTFPHRTPTGTDPKSTSNRQVRTGSNGSSQPTRVQPVRPATPVTSNALKKAVMAKTKAPPLPTFNPTSALGQSNQTTDPIPIVKTDRRVLSAESGKSTKLINKPESTSTAANKPDKRPLQRARVASVATPISGIKQPPRPNPSPPVKTATKIKTPGSASKPTDSKTAKLKPQSGSPKILPSTLKKPSRSPRPVSTTALPFPEHHFPSSPELKDPKPAGSPNPGQMTPNVPPKVKRPLLEGQTQQATCAINKVGEVEEYNESNKLDIRPEGLNGQSRESDQAEDGTDSTQAQQSQQGVIVVTATQEPIDNQIVQDVKDEDHAYVNNVKSLPSVHGLGLTDDEDHSKGDIDASTTNTDGEGEY